MSNPIHCVNKCYIIITHLILLYKQVHKIDTACVR